VAPGVVPDLRLRFAVVPSSFDIAEPEVVAFVRERFGLSADAAEMLDVGDAGSRIFRVRTEHDDLFVKVRPGSANEPGLRLPRFLADRGIDVAVASIATTTGALFGELDGGHVVAYPYVDGASGGEAGMAADHWRRLGAALRRIHDLTVPPELADTMLTEDFTPADLPRVLAIAEAVRERPQDPVVRKLADLWRARRADLDRITERIAVLADLARTRSDERAICHADIHPWNVLVRADGSIAIVDWDDAKLAPRERDLMMIGIFAADDPGGRRAFDEGYGAFEADPVLIAYYQLERVVQDLAANGDEILRDGESDEARKEGLRRMHATFGPGSETEIAIASDAALRDR
jgi:spectinomycin phosphotransferase